MNLEDNNWGTYPTGLEALRGTVRNLAGHKNKKVHELGMALDQIVLNIEKEMNNMKRVNPKFVINEDTSEENPRIAKDIADPFGFLELIASTMQEVVLSGSEVQQLGEDVEHLARRIREELKPTGKTVQFFNKDEYFIADAGMVTDDNGNVTNLSTENVFAIVPRYNTTPEGAKNDILTGIVRPNQFDNIVAKLIIKNKEPQPWTLEDISNQLVLAASNLPTGVPFDSTEPERAHVEALAKLYFATANLLTRDNY